MVVGRAVPSNGRPKKLFSGVRGLQAEAQGLVLRPYEPLVSVRFQGCQLPGHPREVASYDTGDVFWVLLAHQLRAAWSSAFGRPP